MATQSSSGEAMAIGLLPSDNLGPNVVAVNWVLAGVAVVIVGLRVYARAALRREAGWDHYMCFIGLLAALGYSAVQTRQVLESGYGQHTIFLSPQDITNDYILYTAINILNAVALFFIRMSICIFLFRMARVAAKGKPRWSHVLPIWIGIALNACITIGVIIVFAISCVPFRGLWDMSARGFCVDLRIFNDVWRTFAALDVLVDIMLALYSFVLVTNLRLEGNVRAGSYALSFCGLATAGMSIGKAVTQHIELPDATYTLVPHTYFTVLEMYMAIIVCSIPSVYLAVTKRHQTDRFLPTKSSTVGSIVQYHGQPSAGRKCSMWSRVSTLSFKDKSSISLYDVNSSNNLHEITRLCHVSVDHGPIRPPSAKPMFRSHMGKVYGEEPCSYAYAGSHGSD